MAEPHLRLFFALWPDAATRAKLADVARSVAVEAGGRAVAPENIHLTLAFLGAQPETKLSELRRLASGLGVDSFQLPLDRIGCFRRAGIAWIGATAAPPQIIALEASLAHELAGAGIERESRPFSPHLTLVRRIGSRVHRALSPPIRWNVDSFALVASELDSERARYRIIATWQASALSGNATGEAR